MAGAERCFTRPLSTNKLPTTHNCSVIGLPIEQWISTEKTTIYQSTES